MPRFFLQMKHSARTLVHEKSDEVVVEFIGLSVILLVPLTYAILALAQVQTGFFVTEGRTREAARILVDHPEDQTTTLAQAELAFADFHVLFTSSTEVGCRQCFGEFRGASVTVPTLIPLPLLPAWFGERVYMSISVTVASLVNGVRLDG